MNEARIDMLVSRVIDGDVSTEQWNELAQLAQKDPRIWRDLAESQHDQQVLARAVNTAVAVADRVSVRGVNAGRDATMSPADRRSIRARAWSGWLVAAVVALAAMAGRFGSQVQNGSNGQVQTAGFASPDEAFDHYLDLGKKEGTVVGELPTRVIVSSQESPSGEGFELICLRQVVVRQRVPDLYEFAGTDDQGQPTLVKFQPQPEVPDH